MGKNKLWQRFFRPKTPDDRVAAVNRRIDETLERAQKTFLRAAQAIGKEESVRPRPSHGPAASAKVDAVIAKMDRHIRDLRISARQEHREEGTTPFTSSPEAARAMLDDLEKNLERLAERRHEEAAHATEWERRAMMAVAGENDDLAIESLSRKREHEQLHRRISIEHDYGVRVVLLLREMLEGLEGKN